MELIDSKNPDIGLDDLDNVVLRNPLTGKNTNTKVPLEACKQ